MIRELTISKGMVVIIVLLAISISLGTVIVIERENTSKDIK